MKKVFFFFFLLTAVAAGYSQTPNYSRLMDEAKAHFDQKEYVQAITCYEQVLDELKGTEYERLMPAIRNSMAISYLYLGVNALRAKDYAVSKDYLEKAIANAKSQSKTYLMANSWMGQWNSVQALAIRTRRGDYEQAVKFSREAERYFDLAQAPEKRLKEQLARASALESLSKFDEAETLLCQVMSECEGSQERSLIMGKAAYALGGIERVTERFQQAIVHLEQGYNLCISNTTAEAKTYARLCAGRLSLLYSRNIPDAEKESLWKQRADELKDQSVE